MLRVSLTSFCNSLIPLDRVDSDELLELDASLEKRFFDCSLQTKELL